ncbi:MAG: hypothetical protein NXI32_01915 [bacterium]|nr:hypothetical protein [bacterium]
MHQVMHRIVACLVMGVLAICLGCSSESYQPISGSVSFEGQALEKGVITLYPRGEGTTVGGEIIDGSFSLPREKGPTPGKYRVEIIAFRPTGKSEFDIDLNQEVPIEEQFLPQKFNRNSTLEIEVAADGDNAFDFDLRR